MLLLFNIHIITSTYSLISPDICESDLDWAFPHWISTRTQTGQFSSGQGLDIFLTDKFWPGQVLVWTRSGQVLAGQVWPRLLLINSLRKLLINYHFVFKFNNKELIRKKEKKKFKVQSFISFEMWKKIKCRDLWHFQKNIGAIYQFL